MSENPYKSPTPSSAASDNLASPIFAKTAAMFARHLLLMVVIGLILIFVVPRFERMFAEFGIKLSAPTLLVLTISRWFAHYWYLAVILLPLYFLALLGVQSTDRRVTGLLSVFSLLFWLFGSVLVIAIVAAIGLPWWKLMSNLTR